MQSSLRHFSTPLILLFTQQRLPLSANSRQAALGQAPAPCGPGRPSTRHRSLADSAARALCSHRDVGHGQVPATAPAGRGRGEADGLEQLSRPLGPGFSAVMLLTYSPLPVPRFRDHQTPEHPSNLDGLAHAHGLSPTPRCTLDSAPTTSADLGCASGACRPTMLYHSS